MVKKVGALSGIAARKRKIRTSAAYKIGMSANYFIMVLLAIITLYPFWYCIILAFNSGKDALAGGVYFIPRVFTLENFNKAFAHPLIFSSFQMTIYRVSIVVATACFLQCLLGYAFTKRDMPGRTPLIFIFYITTLFSGGAIANYVFYQQIGILNTFWVYVLPNLYSFFYIIILRTFFYTIPDSIQESARIDGASELRIFFQIMLPLSTPAIATIALFIGVSNWNDWFTGAIFVSRRRDLFTAATLLRDIIAASSYESSMDESSGILQFNQAGVALTTTPESLKMAFLVILTLPIMCVYPFLQKYFVKGVMIGSIKE